MTDAFDNAPYSDMTWEHEYGKWLDHEPNNLAHLIRDTSIQIPEWGRELFAALVSGEFSRGKGGRPVERHGHTERSMLSEVFQEWDRAEAAPNMRGTSPKDEACEVVAARRGITSGAVRGVVDKLRKEGITRDLWISWGRPDWKNR